MAVIIRHLSYEAAPAVEESNRVLYSEKGIDAVFKNMHENDNVKAII